MLWGGHCPRALVHMSAQEPLMPEQLARVHVVGDEHPLARMKVHGHLDLQAGTSCPGRLPRRGGATISRRPP
eukprot:6002005-Pyramimonas_sp.AAC.1